jgi:hypothetical protein
VQVKGAEANAALHKAEEAVTMIVDDLTSFTVTKRKANVS